MSENCGYRVSDALLPLLDVSMLLLGLFLIILTAQASKVNETDEGDEPGLPGNVIIIQIDSEARIRLHAQGRIIAVANPQELRQNYLRNFSQDTVVLIKIDDPWSQRANEIYKQCLSSIREAGLRRSRIY